jgi:hypothetical protein
VFSPRPLGDMAQILNAKLASLDKLVWS